MTPDRNTTGKCARRLPGSRCRLSEYLYFSFIIECKNRRIIFLVNHIKRCFRFAWPLVRRNRRCRSVNMICTCRWCNNVSSQLHCCWKDPLTGVPRWVSLATLAASKVCAMPAKIPSCVLGTSTIRRKEATAAAAQQLPQILRQNFSSCARFTVLSWSPALGNLIDPVRVAVYHNRRPSRTTAEMICAALIEHFCRKA